MPYQTQHKLRFITAASLFDGHDVAINIMRRILQSSGAEVIHLGHNRSVNEIVTAALQEDVHGIAISSYQGGHIEFFKYVIDLLRERGGKQIKVFGGGGGVISPNEIKELQDYGVERIYSPQDGQKLGLQGIIDDMLRRADFDLCAKAEKLAKLDMQNLPRIITLLQEEKLSLAFKNEIIKNAKQKNIPVLGITGTGGAGKSSLTDEIIQRFRLDKSDIKIAILAIDPTKRKTGGALLGDRIRMNAIDSPHIFMHSLATRQADQDIPSALTDIILACKCVDFDLIIVETPGIGQGGAGIIPYVDFSIYVMTPEFGASSQLEKIEMLDFADLVVINKFDRRGALDALRDVRKQLQRNHQLFSQDLAQMPVYGTIASLFNDLGVTALYHGLLNLLNQKKIKKWQSNLPQPAQKYTEMQNTVVPAERVRYLAEIANIMHEYQQQTAAQSNIARCLQQLHSSKNLLQAAGKNIEDIAQLIIQQENLLTADNRKLLQQWDQMQQDYAGDEYIMRVRNREIRTQLAHTSLSGLRIPKVSLPRFQDHGERLQWLLKENVPGHFPFTAGVFLFKREGEDPGRMFAGEGDPARTNKRFHYLAEHSEANRLSTAFDSVTLYGTDPAKRPDIYGKVGNSGVSVATLEDMKILYSGFDLCDTKTSVSMTINGPAAAILAMFLNTAIDQQIEKYTATHHHEPDENEKRNIQKWALENVRGTVQADILKEDQAQNTCIFSTEFSLKLMADIQEYFVQHKVQNFYSVSISGYHIAEAGSNPITQLAFTLANGFTYVEAYLARGMHVDEFAPNLSFFFSNGMDPEYSVMGRVARRIWAIALREKYHANERSQKLKYHVQTSGRSLHAQEMAFNDIRTTLEGLIAIYDNCNSLHTNAYDEALTTPTEESVRRAQAIQLIINKEWGLAMNENPLQGSFIIDELTDLVEEAVLKEFDRINTRGGVLGAIETGYQRSKIQEESLYYELKKNDGSLPIVGVNTFVNPHADENLTVKELIRSTEAEKQGQLKRLQEFQNSHQTESAAMLQRLKQAVIKNENVFALLMEAVRVCSLGEISTAFFEVGGKYRRSM